MGDEAQEESGGLFVASETEAPSVPLSMSDDTPSKPKKPFFITDLTFIPLISLGISIIAVIFGVAGFTRSATTSKQLHNIQSNLNSVNSAVGSLQKAIFTQPHSVAVLDLSSPGPYSRMDSFSGGTFYVSLKDVQPYLSGYKVSLDIGNPSDVTYNGFVLDAKLVVII